MAALVVTLAVALAAKPVGAFTLEGLARVNDEGYLVLHGREIALFGIDIPTDDRSCSETVTPRRCGPRAVLVLDSLVRGFVHCELLDARRGGVHEGICTIEGNRLFDDRIDLAAILLRRGWAFADENAPVTYRSLERLARIRGAGMWAEGLWREF